MYNGTEAAERIEALLDLEFDERIGKATARRTYLRTMGVNDSGETLYETRAELAYRVAEGNTAVHPSGLEDKYPLYHAIRTGRLLTAGRHLQHGDMTQPESTGDKFSNCSTSPLTSTLFLLLLNGSGVGRSYDDDVMIVDWREQPRVVLALDPNHPDYHQDIDGVAWSNEFVTPGTAQRIALGDTSTVYHTVQDSREGWAKAVELLETVTYRRTFRAETGDNPPSTVVLDFSKVREKGAPIKGMQNRPASGPVPLMHGLREISKLSYLNGGQEKHGDWAPWQTAMAVDHELAAIVAVGGIRRAARMATKLWSDPGAVDFVKFKRTHRHTNGRVKYNSSNNSVIADKQFWDIVRAGTTKSNVKDRLVFADGSAGWPTDYREYTREDIEGIPMPERVSPNLFLHGLNVFLAATYCSYHDGTGEPGFINGDQLSGNLDGVDKLVERVEKNGIGSVVGYEEFQLDKWSEKLYLDILRVAVKKPMPFITNPCGEIVLAIWGAFCIISDIALGNWVKEYTRIAQRATKDVVEEICHVARLATRFLIRVNTMRTLWHGEVQRTNRIGVGLTGIHELALAQFGLSFNELIDRSNPHAAEFWSMISEVSRAVEDEGRDYSATIGLVAPHTTTTLKPSGSVSKVDSLTEGCHLPAKRMYLRNVQFQTGDPLIQHYRSEGYPTAQLTQGEYRGVHVVGFPTRPFIDVLAERLESYDKIVLASDATPEDQYTWIQLLEQHWLQGNGYHTGNQCSYTLKYDASRVDFEHFTNMLVEYQPTIRCCSVMPDFPISVMPNPYAEVDQFIAKYDGEEALTAVKNVSFEYVPEQILSYDVYQAVERALHKSAATIEDIGFEHLDCGTGGCPISFNDAVVA